MEETPLDCSSLEFSTKEEHRRHLEGQSKLPKGFRVGTAGFRFVPEEVPKEVCMNVTAIVMDEVKCTINSSSMDECVARKGCARAGLKLEDRGGGRGGLVKCRVEEMKDFLAFLDVFVGC